MSARPNRWPWVVAPLAALACIMAYGFFVFVAMDREATVAPWSPSTVGGPWSDRFSLVAGGGLRRAEPGVVAGAAELGRVYVGVRAGDGRVVLSSSSGLWAVERNGRLSPITGVPDSRGDLQLVTLAGGEVAIAAVNGDTVFALPEGANRGRRLADVSKGPGGVSLGPLGIGSADGGLVAIAGNHVLKRRGGVLSPTGPPLWEDDGIREPRGIGKVPGGLLVGSLFPAGGPAAGGDPQQDDGNLVLVGRGGRPRVVYAPDAPHAVRNVAVLPSGPALVAASDSTPDDFDRRALRLAAGPSVDRQSFGYGVGEEFFGWISRRRVVVRMNTGAIRRASWAGPPADWIAPDGGAGNVLVASGGRLWTTRPGLAAPGLSSLWRGSVGVGLGGPARVTVSVLSA